MLLAVVVLSVLAFGGIYFFGRWIVREQRAFEADVLEGLELRERCSNAAYHTHMAQALRMLNRSGSGQSEFDARDKSRREGSLLDMPILY